MDSFPWHQRQIREGRIVALRESEAREIAEANGWKRLATNSAKMVNILGGYGYVPMLASMEQCVEAAQTGRLA